MLSYISLCYHTYLYAIIRISMLSYVSLCYHTYLYAIIRILLGWAMCILCRDILTQGIDIAFSAWCIHLLLYTCILTLCIPCSQTQHQSVLTFYAVNALVGQLCLAAPSCAQEGHSSGTLSFFHGINSCTFAGLVFVWLLNSILQTLSTHSSLVTTHSL